MRDVGHEDGADGVRDFGKALEVDVQGISRGARHDELGLVFLGEALDFVVVDRFVVVTHAVAHHVEVAARVVQVHAVRQVAAVGQAHAHDGVTGLEQRKEHGRVGLRTRVRLNVDGHFHAGGLAKELLGALDGDAFDLVDVLAAAVVALARIAFGVLVGELAALSLHDGRRGVVFAGDHFDVLLLTVGFGLNELPDFAVGHRNGVGVVKHVRGLLLSWVRLVPDIPKNAGKRRRNFGKNNFVIIAQAGGKKSRTTTKPAPKRCCFPQHVGSRLGVYPNQCALIPRSFTRLAMRSSTSGGVFFSPSTGVSRSSV